MNGKMWLHPATQENVKTLKARGAEFIGPDEGMLSCGYEGIGRLWPVEKIAERALKLLRLRGRPFARGFAHETPGLANVQRPAQAAGDSRPEPPRQADASWPMQRDIVLPVKAGVIAVVLYYLFYAGVVRRRADHAAGWCWKRCSDSSWFMSLCNCMWPAAVVVSGGGCRWALFQWLVFTLGLLDGLFVAGLTILSPAVSTASLFWMFPG